MIREQEIFLANTAEREKIVQFLDRFELTFGSPIDYTMGLYEDETLIGTGSLGGRVMRDVAILPEYQGRGLTNRIIRNLEAESIRRGITSNQIYTKPQYAAVFEHMGFTCVTVAKPYAALLERGETTLTTYLTRMRNLLGNGQGKNVGAMVMNCNPFTLGHRYLVEFAAKKCDVVLLFVVQEDRSAFPFCHRFNMIKQGVRDLKNVEVISGGHYIISNATFPTYFIKGSEELAAQTTLDATVFATRIAPALNITIRFVGDEPTDKTTQAYNEAMARVFINNGIELEIIPRRQEQGKIISASAVRRALAQDDWTTVTEMVPPTTLQFLKSPEGAKVIQALKVQMKL